MNLSTIRPLYQHPGPWATVYLDASRSDENAAAVVELRWRALRESLTAQGADSSTVAALDDAVLGHEGLPGNYGLALFGSGGQVRLLELLGAPPRRELAVWDALPHALPLVAQRGEEVAWLRVIADRTGADLTGAATGVSTRVVASEPTGWAVGGIRWGRIGQPVGHAAAASGTTAGGGTRGTAAGAPTPTDETRAAGSGTQAMTGAARTTTGGARGTTGGARGTTGAARGTTGAARGTTGAARTTTGGARGTTGGPAGTITGTPSGRGGIGQQVTGDETFPIRKSKPGGWSQSRFQRAAEEAWQRNAGDVASATAHLADEIGAHVLIVGGDIRAAQLLVEQLPARWRDRVLRTEAGSRAPGADNEELDEVTARAVAEVAERHTLDALERFMIQYGNDAAAGSGLAAVVAALQRGQADTVLIVDDPSATGELWIGPEPTQIAMDADELRAMGVDEPVRTRADAALLRAIALTHARLALVPPGKAPLSGGVGAVLRYADAGTRRR